METLNRKPHQIEFFSLREQNRQIEGELNEAFHRVMERGHFVLGEEVRAFEEEFAGWVGTRHAVGVASGTDALTLALLALEIGPGDEVITAANTAVPTVVAICRAGAAPVLIDIEENGFHIDPGRMERAIGPRTRALLPVHLYGEPARMDAILQAAETSGLPVIEDACQAHGAKAGSKPAGGLGTMGCFSFYPTKNLGCYGDGGMVTLNDETLYNRLILLRNYGQKSKYEHVSVGLNSRLDELQAAFLRIKLRRLDGWNLKRKQIAELYRETIRHPRVTLPRWDADRQSAHHLFVIRSDKRDRLRQWLEENGIGTMIHYPTPVHLQPAFQYLPYRKGIFPRAEKHAGSVLSLPLYPELSLEDARHIATVINQFPPES